MLENDLIEWLTDTLGIAAHYQHLDRKPAAEFAWLIRNGDERLDCLDDGPQEPEIVYFDLEIYAQTPARIQQLAQAMREQNDYGGPIGSGGGTVADIEIADQRDDYTPQAAAETLPPFAVAYRMTASNYAA